MWHSIRCMLCVYSAAFRYCKDNPQSWGHVPLNDWLIDWYRIVTPRPANRVKMNLACSMNWMTSSLYLLCMLQTIICQLTNKLQPKSTEWKSSKRLSHFGFTAKVYGTVTESICRHNGNPHLRRRQERHLYLQSPARFLYVTKTAHTSELYS